MRQCEVCGGVALRRFCSQRCNNATRKTRVEWTCCLCGKAFSLRGDLARLGGPRSCSLGCAAKYNGQLRKRPEPERFWALVDRSNPDGCWPWMGARDAHGYGLFSLDGRKQIVASRYALSTVLGPLSPEIFACHNCPDGDNPPCCRPDHLFPGTRRRNAADAVAKGRYRRGSAHGRSRLSDEQRREIVTRYESTTIKGELLAEEYGVTKQTIYNIVNAARAVRA